MKGFSIAGHIAIDEVITDTESYHQLGGPPCFAASLGKTLGFDVKVITRFGEDFPEEYEPTLDMLGISTKRSACYQNTRFVLDYRYNPRRMRLPTICEPIHPRDVANSERLLLCPIAGEINDQLMEEIDSSFIGLDPQGLLRNIDSDSNVIP